MKMNVGFYLVSILLGVSVLGCASTGKTFDESKLEYLEEIEGERALAWVRAQNDRSLQLLEADPLYSSFLSQAQKIITTPERIPYGSLRGGWIYNFWQDKKNVRGLWRRVRPEQYGKPQPAWEVLIDVDKLAASEKENWVFAGASCLGPEYRRCLLSFSQGGKDASVVREFDLKTKRFVKDGFVLPESKSTVAWAGENEVLVATNWGEGSLTDSGYPRIVKRWKRGSPLSSAEVVYEGGSESVRSFPVSILRPEGTFQFVIEATSFFKTTYFLVGEEGALVRLPLPESAEFVDVFQGQMLLRLREDWKMKGPVGALVYRSGELLSFSLVDFLKTKQLGKVSTVFRPTETMSLEDTGASRNVFYVSYLENVVGKISEFRFEEGKWTSKPVPIEDKGTVSLISMDPFDHRSLVNYSGYLKPSQLFFLDSKLNSLQKVRELPAQFDADDLMVEQIFAKSKDGTAVPYFLVRKKNLELSGKNPTLLYGYGGFEVSMTPAYSGVNGKLWLERGGVFAVANIRGGGEFGPRWHQAALKENRQKAFDDFIAVAEDLIARKITSPQHLGIEGGSNGGLLVGAALTQRPELFNAVVCQVPLLDMLRFHLLLAGASWKAEYGDPEVSSERAYIKAYSPLQKLNGETKYPEVFFVTSTKDDRVHPAHARKMAAKMESLGHPFLYYENIEGGHSASANLLQTARRTTLEMVYLSRKLGLVEPK